MSEIIGWWFAAKDKLPNGDGRPVVLGATLTVEPPIVPCKHGLHASIDPLDALKYAPGPILYKVRLSGEIIAHGGDKHAASERTALARRDATDMLRLFARRQALSVIHLWKAPVIVREYLETGDESKRSTAEVSAGAAARAARAAESAARAFACGAAWARAARAASARAAEAAEAAESATWVVEAVAWAAWAAESAARAFACGAAWDTTCDTVWAAAWGAATASARASTWDTAMAAAGAAARKMFGEMVEEIFSGER